MDSPLQVCMETSDWFKAIVASDSAATGSPSIDNNSSSSPSPSATTAVLLAPPPPSTDRRLLRPPHDHPLKCPRCDSSHTKFCYYNNYSLSQPRYFCKTCRRYWTKGGSLRNVPVGGGCRKNKRPSSAAKKHDIVRPQFNVPAPVPTDLQLSSLFTGSCDFGGSLGFPMDYSMMSYEAQEDVKPGSRMLSLEWPEQAGYCLDSSYGFGIWAAGMIGGDGPSSAAM